MKKNFRLGFLFSKKFFYLCENKFSFMDFKNHFNSELKRLNLTRKMVCERLGMTIPTLRSRVNSPLSFTLNEISKLQSIGFNLNRLI